MTIRYLNITISEYNARSTNVIVGNVYNSIFHDGTIAARARETRDVEGRCMQQCLLTEKAPSAT